MPYVRLARSPADAEATVKIGAVAHGTSSMSLDCSHKQSVREDPTKRERERERERERVR
jgi:hypothetical protein